MVILRLNIGRHIEKEMSVIRKHRTKSEIKDMIVCVEKKKKEVGDHVELNGSRNL